MPQENANGAKTRAPLLTVLVMQYRPAWEKLKLTLDSILMQDTREFELVITDDGSPQDWFAETRQYLAAHGLTDVKFRKNPTNLGTVRNIRNGLAAACGEWVALISPGDGFYDRGTLAWELETIRRDAPAVAFGRAAYYRLNADGIPEQCPGDTPFDRSCYDPARYDARRVERNLVLYSDHICGLELLCRRDIWQRALAMMDGRVKFAEDFATLLFAAEGTRMRPYDRVIAWYEYGTGISTDQTAASERRLQADLKAMIALLREKYPRDRAVWLAYQYFFNDRHASRLVRGLIGRAIVPQWLPFKRAQRSWRPPTNGDGQKLQELYHYDQGEPL